MSEQAKTGLDEVIQYVAGFGRGIVEHASRLDGLREHVDVGFASMSSRTDKIETSVQQSSTDLSDRLLRIGQEVTNAVTECTELTTASISASTQASSNLVLRTEEEIQKEASRVIDKVSDSMQSQANRLNSRIDEARAVLERTVQDSQYAANVTLIDRMSKVNSDIQTQTSALQRQLSGVQLETLQRLVAQSDRLSKEMSSAERNLTRIATNVHDGLKGEMNQAFDEFRSKASLLAKAQVELLTSVADIDSEMQSRFKSLYKCVLVLFFIDILTVGGLGYLLLRSV